MKTQLRSIIKVEIEQVFGRRVISSRDCIELSEEIYNRTQERLNQNTLRRFFGLVKSEYPPSHSTLSILSKYCGFQTLDDAYKVRTKNPEPEKAVNTDSILHYLVSMFRNVPVRNVQDRTFLNMIKQTVQFVDTMDGLADKFQNQIVRTGNGSSIFFEHMVYIDKLNDHYGRALRYYLKEKGTFEAEIFVNSLNAIRHWLNGENEQLEKVTLHLLNERVPKLKNTANWARYFAAILLYQEAFGIDSDELKSRIRERLDIIEAENYTKDEIFKFCYIIAQAMSLTGQYADALHYMEKAPKLATTDPEQDQSVYCYQSMALLHSYVLHKLGAEGEAEKVLHAVKPSEFYFLQKKLSNIFYLYLLREVKHNGKKYQEQLSYLIEETGFVRLKKILE